MINGVEREKNNVENNIYRTTLNNPSSPLIEDYRRQAAEYQVRLTSLQTKLSCSAAN
jgi:hypothetical protein